MGRPGQQCQGAQPGADRGEEESGVEGLSVQPLRLLNLPGLDDDTKLWRYMSFGKFISLLKSRSLYFSRFDLLGDSHEGSIPNAMLNEILRDPIGHGTPENHRQYLDGIRYRAHVCCWHIAECESHAMWRIYSHGDCAVAIQTTLGKLKQSISSVGSLFSFYACVVKYIDYDLENINSDNPLEVLAYKRKCFEYENEFRLFCMQSPEHHEDFGSFGDRIRDQTRGSHVPISARHLIERVVLRPCGHDGITTETHWEWSAVAAVIKKFGLSHQIVARSSLDREPRR